MTYEDTLDNIREALVERLDAVGIVLVGSRAVGDYRPDSDWDVYCWTPLKTAGRTNTQVWAANGGFPLLDGVDVDVIFLPEDQEFDFDVFWLKLRYAEPVLDKTGIVAKTLSQAQAFYADGPDPWSPDYARSREKKSRHYVEKMRSLLERGEREHCFLRLSWYYAEQAVPFWFGLRAEWELRPQQAFDHIREREPAYAEQLSVIAGDSSLSEKVEACARVYELLFESEKFHSLLGDQ